VLLKSDLAVRQTGLCLGPFDSLVAKKIPNYPGMNLKCALLANPSSWKKKVIALNQRDQSQTNDDTAHHQKT
jgi:hypothetical protein